MGGPDDQLDFPIWDVIDAVTTIAIAEGILMERYHVPAPVAAALLCSHAAATDRAAVETAHHLIGTGRLPQYF